MQHKEKLSSSKIKVQPMDPIRKSLLLVSTLIRTISKTNFPITSHYKPSNFFVQIKTSFMILKSSQSQSKKPTIKSVGLQFCII